MRSTRYFLLVLVLLLVAPREMYAQQYAPYICLSDHVDIFAYENGSDPKLTFDDKGIILSDQKYHPVVTAIYGILCYDHFLATNDSSYRDKVLAQARFFLDQAHYTEAFGGKGIGLPYNFAFHDLQPPWYSGMAQGISISFLLRYRALSGDPKVDELCRKLAYFMLQDENEGGTMGRLDDGQPWIEEYPLSEEAPHVLNGAINAWIGLHEYCIAFPDDLRASLLRDSVRQAMLNGLNAYNLSWWCRYDLGERVCSPSYLRYHIFQLEQLFRITGDPRLLDQQALWAAFLSGKAIEDEPRFSHRDYNWAVPAMRKVHGWTEPNYGLKSLLGGPGGVVSMSYLLPDPAALEQALQGGVPTEKSKATSRSEVYALYNFSEAIHADFLTLGFNHRMDSVKIEPFAVTRDNQLIPLPHESVRGGTRFWQAKLAPPIPDQGYNRLVLKFSGEHAETVQKLQIGVYDSGKLDLPRFGFYRTSGIALEAGKKYRIDVPAELAGKIRIYYRTSPRMAELGQANFSTERMVKNGILEANISELHQFLVVYEIRDLLTLVSMLRWKELEE